MARVTISPSLREDEEPVEMMYVGNGVNITYYAASGRKYRVSAGIQFTAAKDDQASLMKSKNASMGPHFKVIRGKKAEVVQAAVIHNSLPLPPAPPAGEPKSEKLSDSPKSTSSKEK